MDVSKDCFFNNNLFYFSQFRNKMQKQDNYRDLFFFLIQIFIKTKYQVRRNDLTSFCKNHTFFKHRPEVR